MRLRLYLFLTVLKKQWRIMLSYGFNSLVQVFTLALFFALLYFGMAQVAAPQTQSESTEALILGFWIWTGLLTSLSQFTWTIDTYAQQGLLEQLFMTPWRLKQVLAVEAAASFVLDTLLINGILLFVFMFISQHWLALEPVTTLALYVLTLLPGYGLGYALAGLAMRYKNIQSVFNIVQFLPIPLQMLPVERYPWLNVFPFAQGMRMLLQHARQGMGLTAYPLEQWLILIAQAAGYLVLGLLIYDRLERAARERGLLAHY